ncbi:T9SS type A sorting domain-containing protein, partial [bacterium]|nr:T9SS type A sorting domain-containing protein [bacterium]
LDFYTSGAGQKGIFWVGWGGTSFAADTTWIGEFLDAGGNLFLSAQDVVGGGFELGYDEGVVIPADHWLNRYMGIKGVFDDYNLDSTFTLYGMAGDPISDDFQAGIEVSPYYWVGPGYNYAGRFDSLDANAELVFMDGFGANLGYRMDTGTYKIVFLYWPFNYIGSYIEEDTVAQITLIENVRDWMGLTAIDEPEVTTIKELTLYQATPNPFARFTTIKYAMPQAGRVSLKVYNLSGRVVNTILDDQVESGIHSVMWDGKDSNGQKVPAGVYFYQLRTGNTNATQKTIMIR